MVNTPLQMLYNHSDSDDSGELTVTIVSSP